MHSLHKVCLLVFASAFVRAAGLLDDEDSVSSALPCLLQMSHSSIFREGAATWDALLDGHFKKQASCGELNLHVAPSPKVRNVTGIQWLHIPKAGTSFIATIWNYACGQEGSPLDLAVDPHSRVGCASCYDFALMDRYPRHSYCKHGILGNFFQTQHLPLFSHRQQLLHEEWIGFFRKPSQRLISAFHDGMHANGFPSEEWQKLLHKCKQNVGCYARYPGIAGCSARMLAGQTCAKMPGRGWDGGLSHLEQALQALAKMSFVGLTERWDESVCLFHRMFGGRMSTAQMIDYHHGPSHAQLYDEKVLEGFRDDVDEQIYEAAVQRFEALLQEHVPAHETPCAGLQPAVDSGGLANGLCSCEVSGRECGRGEAVDCGMCPTPRLEFAHAGRLARTLSCSQKQGKCLLKGKPVNLLYNNNNLFSWKI